MSYRRWGRSPPPPACLGGCPGGIEAAWAPDVDDISKAVKLIFTADYRAFRADCRADYRADYVVFGADYKAFRADYRAHCF